MQREVIEIACALYMPVCSVCIWCVVSVQAQYVCRAGSGWHTLRTGHIPTSAACCWAVPCCTRLHADHTRCPLTRACLCQGEGRAKDARFEPATSFEDGTVLYEAAALAAVNYEDLLSP